MTETGRQGNIEAPPGTSPPGGLHLPPPLLTLPASPNGRDIANFLCEYMATVQTSVWVSHKTLETVGILDTHQKQCIGAFLRYNVYGQISNGSIKVTIAGRRVVKYYERKENGRYINQKVFEYLLKPNVF